MMYDTQELAQAIKIVAEDMMLAADVDADEGVMIVSAEGIDAVDDSGNADLDAAYRMVATVDQDQLWAAFAVAFPGHPAVTAN